MCCFADRDCMTKHKPRTLSQTHDYREVLFSRMVATVCLRAQNIGCVPVEHSWKRSILLHQRLQRPNERQRLDVSLPPHVSRHARCQGYSTLT